MFESCRAHHTLYHLREVITGSQLRRCDRNRTESAGCGVWNAVCSFRAEEAVMYISIGALILIIILLILIF
jgi:hypothetical protein